MDDTLSARLAGGGSPTKVPVAKPAPPPEPMSPPSFLTVPRTIEETGLEEGFLVDLLLKVMYTGGPMTGFQIAERLKLTPPVVNRLLEPLRRVKLLEETKGATDQRLDYTNILTTEGRNRARESMEVNTYAGPCPVPLAVYNEGVAAQPLYGQAMGVDRALLEESLSHLVLDEGLIERLGPAVNAWRALFIHGPAGNGKTAIAEAVASTVSEACYIPHAVLVDGQVIKVFDMVTHKPLDPPWGAYPEAAWTTGEATTDPRWVWCRRPFIVTGGELTLAMLDLTFDPHVRYYEAPLQLKANGGVLLVDDFGRQMVSPRDLLNRWIVPMEHRRDYLTLYSGQKFGVPFDILTIFATNIEPRDLVDEAFLRRIPYKVEVVDPTPEQFLLIFARNCEQQGLEYDEEVVKSLLDGYYRERGLPLRACHPRDLVALIVHRAGFLDEQPRLTEETLLEACQTYFVD